MGSAPAIRAHPIRKNKVLLFRKRQRVVSPFDYSFKHASSYACLILHQKLGEVTKDSKHTRSSIENESFGSLPTFR